MDNFPTEWRVEQFVPQSGKWEPVGGWHDSYEFCIRVMRDYVEYVKKYNLKNNAHQFRVTADNGEVLPGEIFG